MQILIFMILQEGLEPQNKLKSVADGFRGVLNRKEEQ